MHLENDIRWKLVYFLFLKINEPRLEIRRTDFRFLDGRPPLFKKEKAEDISFLLFEVHFAMLPRHEKLEKQHSLQSPRQYPCLLFFMRRIHLAGQISGELAEFLFEFRGVVPYRDGDWAFRSSDRDWPLVHRAFQDRHHHLQRQSPLSSFGHVDLELHLLLLDFAHLDRDEFPIKRKFGLGHFLRPLASQCPFSLFGRVSIHVGQRHPRLPKRPPIRSGFLKIPYKTSFF